MRIKKSRSPINVENLFILKYNRLLLSRVHLAAPYEMCRLPANPFKKKKLFGLSYVFKQETGEGKIINRILFEYVISPSWNDVADR